MLAQQPSRIQYVLRSGLGAVGGVIGAADDVDLQQYTSSPR